MFNYTTNISYFFVKMNAASSCHIWRLRNVGVKYLLCKICKWICATGQRKNGTTGHRLVEFWKRHDMKNNVKVTLAMRISTQPSTIRIMIGQKPPENMECFNYLGVPITRTRGVNSRMITSGIYLLAPELFF